MADVKQEISCSISKAAWSVYLLAAFKAMLSDGTEIWNAKDGQWLENNE